MREIFVNGSRLFMSAMSFRTEKMSSSSLQIDLNDMTQEEIADFEKVMNRIDAINELEANRIRRLKSLIGSQNNNPKILLNLNHKALRNLLCKSCGSYCLSSNIFTGKPSTRSSMLCRVCQMPVCNSCWRSAEDKQLKICPACHKKIILDAKSGNWFHQQMKKRMSIEQSPDLSRISANTVKEMPANHSPKKKLLHRLRSYNSVHEELDEMDNILRLHSPTPITKWSANEQREYSQKRSENSPSFYINSELESEDEVKLDLSDDVVNSNKNYYRPLSHISNQPLKSCSNGSPVPLEDHTTDVCKTNIETNTNNIIPSPGGEVLIELDFNFRMSQFIIILRQCRNLPQIDGSSSTICPYLFVLLLPDRSKKSRRTTSVKKNCFFPIFDQIFKYSINFTELESRSVLVMLCHKDDLSSRDLALGQVIIPLSFMDFSRPIIRWYSFQLLIDPNLNQSRVERSFSSGPARNSNIPAYFGEISLAIKHVPRNFPTATNANHSESFGELHVWVKSMRNVAQHQLNYSNISVTPSRRFSTSEEKGITDNRIIDNISFGSSKILSAVAQLGQNQPVARVCLLPYRTSMQTTSPAKSQSENSSQYVWSTILKFPNVDIEELRTRSLEVTIWVNSRHGWLNRIIHPRCVGGVRLCRGGRECEVSPRQSNQCRGASTGIIEEKMWAAMLDRNNTWVDGTIKLKMDSSFLNMNIPEFQ